MKLPNILILIALFSAGALRAENSGGANAKGVGGTSAELTELISGSRWAWYEGDYDRYTKGKMKYWVEFYKDGTARVPWRGNAQSWQFTGPNVLTVSDPKAGDKSTFTMNLAEKAGSTASGHLHIRYEKKATKPGRWK